MEDQSTPNRAVDREAIKEVVLAAAERSELEPDALAQGLILAFDRINAAWATPPVCP